MLQIVGTAFVRLVCRFRVTGEIPAHLRSRPFILAANHISNFDPFCMTAGTRFLRFAPRIMATGGLFRAPVAGRAMAAMGHIPVDRGRETVAHAVPTAIDAVRDGSPVCVYPEGRIGLDPALWPERFKTGLARLALATGVPVIPVATWGSHEVMAYHGAGAMLRSLLVSALRRPTVRMHFGTPVDLSDLSEGAIGHAQRATDRIMTALVTELAAIRGDEPGVPRFIDPTRPISAARSYRLRPPTVRMIDHGEVLGASGP
jgi:1-acyl-sn-glycerol-3-phosphate acyltransferase